MGLISLGSVPYNSLCCCFLRWLPAWNQYTYLFCIETYSTRQKLVAHKNNSHVSVLLQKTGSPGVASQNWRSPAMGSTKLHVVRLDGPSRRLQRCLQHTPCCQDVDSDYDKLRDTGEALIAGNNAFGLHLIE